MKLDLSRKSCTACRVGAPTLKKDEVKSYLSLVSSKWEVFDEYRKIRREFVYDSFVSAMKFVDDVAALSESQGHHPDIHIYNYKHVRIELWTHKIQGLHENDFILAYKIDELASSH